MSMKIDNFDDVKKELWIDVPDVYEGGNPMRSVPFGVIDLWNEDAEELQGVKQELLQKWSDAALKDRVGTHITADEVMELIAVRGMSLMIDA